MKRSLLIVSAICALMLGVAPLVYAVGWAPVEDATGFASVATDDAELRAVSGGTGGCSVTATSYMKFDLSGVTLLIGSAKLTLTLTRVNVGSGSAKLALWSVTDDTWTESSVLANSPALITELASVTYPAGGQPSLGGLVIFDSNTLDPRLVNFLNDQLDTDPDQLVTLALRVTECGTGVYEYRVGSSENGNSAARPSLELSTPTAVRLASLDGRVESTVAWPLYAGLAVLGLATAVAVILSRRRATF